MNESVRARTRENEKGKKDPVSQVNQIAGTKPEVNAKRSTSCPTKVAFILKATGGTLLG